MDTIIFKVDKKIKGKAQKKCKEIGISLSHFLRMMTKALADRSIEAELVIRNIKHHQKRDDF